MKPIKTTTNSVNSNVMPYTNAIINIFRVAKLTNDLEKGFELYQKIR